MNGADSDPLFHLGETNTHPCSYYYDQEVNYLFFKRNAALFCAVLMFEAVIKQNLIWQAEGTLSS